MTLANVAAHEKLNALKHRNSTQAHANVNALNRGLNARMLRNLTMLHAHAFVRINQ